MLSCSQTAAGFVLTDAVTCTQIAARVVLTDTVTCTQTAVWLEAMLPADHLALLSTTEIACTALSSARQIVDEQVSMFHVCWSLHSVPTYRSGL